jgi:CubicO group peptidase (beta-lactamase class C family)
MLRIFKILVIFSAWISSNLALADTSNQKMSKTIKQKLTITLENIRADNSVPAMSVGIIEGGEIFYQEGFGLDASKQIVSGNTQFRVASITKLFTSQAVMQLVEQDKLSLDDKAGKYFAKFSDKDISLFELMTHHSGLKDKVRPKKINKQHSFEKYFQRSIEKQNKLEKSFEYADLNFNVLGAIVAKVSGKSYPDYIKEHILTPLNLSNTGFIQLSNSFLPDVDPYINGWILRKAVHRPFDPSFSPSEGLVASVNDLLIWLKATLSQDEKLLQTKSYQQMLIPRKSTEWGEIKMGLGWQLYSNEHGKVIQHAGSVAGVQALLIAYPDIQRGIVILSNADELPRWDIAKSINKILKSNPHRL